MRKFSVSGLDGCRGGWIAVTLELPDRIASAERIDSIEKLFQRAELPEAIAIDIPVGLPEFVMAKGRTPERLIRPRLGARQSSVFSTPSRNAIYAGINPALPEADRYRQACAIARETSECKKAVSKQAFHIFPKIVEIDSFLRSHKEFTERVYECHPEVSFWAMNREKPLPEPKKIKGKPSAAGIGLRRKLLAAHDFQQSIMSDELARSLEIGVDDLIDACAACWTAARIAEEKAISFPNAPERDAFGLPIAIWA